MADEKKESILLPSIGMTKLDPYDGKVIFINGFNSENLGDQSWFDKLQTPYETYRIIHPYYLMNGKNNVEAAVWVQDNEYVEDQAAPPKMHSLIFTLTYLDYKNFASDKPITKIEFLNFNRKTATEAKKNTLSASFNFASQIPVWSWTHGIKIENSEKTRLSLYEAYKKFWGALNALSPVSKTMNAAERKDFQEKLRQSTKEFVQASELRGETYEEINKLLSMATTLKDRNIPVRLKELAEIKDLGLSIFAGGTLAKLIIEPKSFFARPLYVEYAGGVHDRSPGPAGEVFELWFRKDATGNWIVDTICPLSGLKY